MLLLLSALLPDVCGLSTAQLVALVAAVDAAGLGDWGDLHPLNEIDSISDHVLTDVFALGEGLGWFVLLPLVAMPLVLKLQQRWLRPGAGSGIPQADACIEDPELAPKLLGLRPLLSRLVLGPSPLVACCPSAGRVRLSLLVPVLFG